MNFYEQHILPHIIHCACTSPPIQKLRKSVVPKARGTVLEVGMGSATNLEFYDASKVDIIWGLEPSQGMRKKAQKNLNQSSIAVNWLSLKGEHVSLPDNCIDTALLTFTLCTIPDYEMALQQIRRVLKPDGQLVFCEHGLAEERKIQQWQHRLNLYWNKMAGGCNLNRRMDQLIENAGFRINDLQKRHIPKTPKIASYIYQGSATIR